MGIFRPGSYRNRHAHTHACFLQSIAELTRQLPHLSKHPRHFFYQRSTCKQGLTRDRPSRAGPPVWIAHHRPQYHMGRLHKIGRPACSAGPFSSNLILSAGAILYVAQRAGKLRVAGHSWDFCCQPTGRGGKLACSGRSSNSGRRAASMVRKTAEGHRCKNKR